MFALLLSFFRHGFYFYVCQAFHHSCWFLGVCHIPVHVGKKSILFLRMNLEKSVLIGQCLFYTKWSLVTCSLLSFSDQEHWFARKESVVFFFFNNVLSPIKNYSCHKLWKNFNLRRKDVLKHATKILCLLSKLHLLASRGGEQALPCAQAMPWQWWSKETYKTSKRK